MLTPDGVLVQAVFHSHTGLPKDRINWTFHFKRNIVAMQSAAALAAASEMVWRAITDAQGLGNKLEAFLSTTLSGPLDVKAYDLGHGEPRTPVTWSSSFQPTASPTLPSEVACCLSYKTSSANVPATHRGRVYIGPLNNSALSETSLEPRPGSTFRGACLDLAQRLYDGASLFSGEWAVFSRKDNELRPVNFAWVDNAFDTQRRRGVAANARFTLELTG